MWALFEEAVSAEAMSQVVVLPWLAIRDRPVHHRLTVHEDLDAAYVTSEITSIVVRLGQCVERHED